MNESDGNGARDALPSGAVTPALAVLAAALDTYLIKVQANGLGRSLMLTYSPRPAHSRCTAAA